MKVVSTLAGIVVAVLCLHAQTTESSSPEADEQTDLTRAVQQAGGSPIDFIRALERFLQKHPQSKLQDRIYLSLFQAAKETNDQPRIARYGEELLKSDPDDISVLPFVGTALNTFDNQAASERALAVGERLEKRSRQQLAQKSDEQTEEQNKRRYNQQRNLGRALTIEADAFGIAGRTGDAVKKAHEAFASLPTAEAARSLGRWQARAGQFDDAVTAYANAFAIADTPEHHAEDRRKLAEFYSRTHRDEKGLGDIVLAAYDRMTAANDQLQQQYGRAQPAKLAEFELSGISGGKLALASLKGKVVVMDFWATWCGPCRVQHPLFEQVKTKYKDDTRVVFLELNSDEDRSNVSPFLKQQGWNPAVYYAGDLTQSLRIQSIPTTVLLDRKGEVYSKMIGFRPDEFATLLTSRIEDALRDGS